MFREATVNNLGGIPFWECVCYLNDTSYLHIHKYFFKTEVLLHLSMVLGVLELQARNSFVAALSQLFV